METIRGSHPGDAGVLLVFGDSNARGYGTAAASAYPVRLASALNESPTGRYHLEVGSAHLGFGQTADRLERLIVRYRPTLVVWQVPNGPIKPIRDWPGWLLHVQRLFRRSVAPGARKLVENDAPDEATASLPERRSTREEVWIDETDGLNLGRGLLLQWLRAHVASVSPRTMAIETYLEQCARVTSLLRGLTTSHVVVVGPLPHDEHIMPGYADRARQIEARLAPIVAAVPGCTFLPVLARLDARGKVLRRDGRHLVDDAHAWLGQTIAEACVGAVDDVSGV